MSSEIQFCTDCSNLLYPKEDREHRQLIFLCRSCDHLQYADPYSATQNCVDRLNYNFRSKEDVNSYIAQGLGHDPTLPRAPDWRCPKCANLGAVYFQLPERVADDAMTLVFVCTNCTFYQVKGKETRDKQDDDEDDEAVAEANKEASGGATGPVKVMEDELPVGEDQEPLDDEDLFGDAEDQPTNDLDIKMDDEDPMAAGDDDLGLPEDYPDEDQPSPGD